MRKESRIVIESFLNRKPKKMKNTESTGQELRLFGNTIAWHVGDENIGITMAGWGSDTTRDRLNTLFRLAKISAGIFQRDHEQYISCEGETKPLGTRDVYYFYFAKP